MGKLTKAERATLTACPDWSASYEIAHRRNDATGEIVDLGGQHNILVQLRKRGLVEYGPPNNTWRITPTGRAMLEASDGE